MKKESKADIIRRLQESLNAQQRSVPQLPAQAHAKKIKALGSKTDPKHPFSGYMVGADESADNNDQPLNELSPETLASYKKKAGAAASAADKAGDYEKGHKRFKGIVKATNKEFEKSAKKGVEENSNERNKQIESERKSYLENKLKEIDSQLKKLKDSGMTAPSLYNMPTITKIDQLEKDRREVVELLKYSFKKGVAEQSTVENENISESSVQVFSNITDAYINAQHLNKKVVRSAGGYFKIVDRNDPGAELIPDENFLKQQRDLINKIKQINNTIEQTIKYPHDRIRAKLRDRHPDSSNDNKFTSDAAWGRAVRDLHSKFYNSPEAKKLNLEKSKLNKELSDLRKSGKSVKELSTRSNQITTEAIANEDVLSALKTKLGDLLLQTLGKQAVDGDLKDKPNSQDDKEINPIIKKIKTDDGHEICIHGNEDDGFRISVKQKEAPSKFNTLDEAVMACEMYCAHRRNNLSNRDYVDEA